MSEQIKQKQEEANKLGRSTVDSEMLQAEIKDLEIVQARMTRQQKSFGWSCMPFRASESIEKW